MLLDILEDFASNYPINARVHHVKTVEFALMALTITHATVYQALTDLSLNFEFFFNSIFYLNNFISNKLSCANMINYCESEPCLNSGVCLEQFNSFTCTCLPGYTGPTCGLSINYCASFPCYTGTCVNNATFGTYSCTCPVGFSGVNCQNAVNSCTSSPCQNSGTCFQLAAGGYKCVCNEDYTGTYCEQIVDYCTLIQCNNGATCVNSLGNFICVCPFGYNGTYCDNCISSCFFIF